MTAPREVLDQLDALHAAATTGPWENPRPFTKLIDAPGSTDNLAIVKADNVADAALIVAAVNTLPQLTAALRAALAYCDDMDRADFFPGLASTDAIRTRITAALSPAEIQP